MDEILKKIHDLEQYLLKNNCYFEGAEWTFGKIKEIILSSQKEPIGNTKQLTIGDKIRESNESLAEFIEDTNKACAYCDYNFNQAKCSEISCVKGILEHLNQPTT